MFRFLFSVLICVGMAAGAEGNWPNWRGPHLNGTSDATGLPVQWSETEHIAWKVPLPAWSGGTPVLWGDRIFVTSPSKEESTEKVSGDGNGTPMSNPGGSELLLLCLDKNSGALRWTSELDTGNELRRKQNDSSPSPVTDGTHVWAVTGTGAVVALDLEGKILWKHHLQEEYGPFGQMFGYASSPILFDGKLIVQVLHGYRTDEPSYLAAFDALTGELCWRYERPTDQEGESPDAYTTPTLLEFGGRTHIVVAGGGYVTGHNPDTGEEYWRVGGLNPRNSKNWRIIASPVPMRDRIFVPTRKRPFLAVRLQGPTDKPEAAVDWVWDESGGPDVPTPACDGRYLYMVDDRGKATCVEPETGKAVWGPENTAEGTVSASPLLADGKLYITNEDGVTTVLASGPEFKILATNTVDSEYTLSSLAASGNRLFLRTDGYLYCIGGGTP